MSKKTVKANEGSERLIPKKEWLPPSAIQGEEIKTLRSPMIEKAFQEILRQYKPKHDVALVSLCTATRPYSKSRKWKTFIEKFGDDADMIVCSNGGIIPLEFESCYPYLTYDAHGEGKYDKLYINTMYRRMSIFFEKFKYKKIILNFRPNMRNRIGALAFQRDYKGDAEVIILPTKEIYGDIQKAGFPEGRMFPDLATPVLKQLETAIKRK